MKISLMIIGIVFLSGENALFAQSQVDDLNKKELIALLAQLDSSLGAERVLLNKEEDNLDGLSNSISDNSQLIKGLSERRESLSDTLTQINARIQLAQKDRESISNLLEREAHLAAKSISIRNDSRFSVTSDKVDSVSYSDPSGTSYYRIQVELVAGGASYPVDSYVCIMKSAGECGQNNSQGFDSDLLVFPNQIRLDLILGSVILGREISRQNTVYTRMAAIYGLDEILIIEYELGFRGNSSDVPIRMVKSIPL